MEHTKNYDVKEDSLSSLSVCSTFAAATSGFGRSLSEIETSFVIKIVLLLINLLVVHV